MKEELGSGSFFLLLLEGTDKSRFIGANSSNNH